MLKRNELAVPFSCLNKAASDEPLFVLRANDPLFAPTVRLWAAMADEVHSPDKISDAHNIADEGDKWRQDRQPVGAIAGSAIGNEQQRRGNPLR